MRLVSNKYFRALLVAAILILMSVALSSCGVLKNHYLQKYCRSTDSIHEVTNTVFLDTVINVTDTAFKPFYLPNPCQYLCDSLGRLKPVKIKHTSNGMTKTIESRNGQLMIDCDLEGYKAKVRNAIRVTLHDKFKHTTTEVKVNELTKLQGFWIIIGMCLTVFFALQVIVKALMSIYPVTKPFITWLYWMRF